MDNEDLIREQMEQTRTSLTEKIETLEKEVADKVQATAGNVADTVASVKDAVQETVDSVKGGVEDTVDSVKSLFDLPAHVERHPVAVFSGAVAVGFVLGRLLQTSKQAVPSAPAVAEAPGTELLQRRHGNGKQHPRPAPASTGILSKFAPELDKIKGLALGALMDVVRHMAENAVPPNYEEPMEEIIQSFTEKIGGTPLQPKSANSGIGTNRMSARPLS
jgi:ElaB/YqjD/DUF883 family membrane-anchored ribosome-binding protein